LTSTTLEFELRAQEFIALIKQDKYTEAVKYAKKNLAKFADENLDQLKKLMGLLSFKNEVLVFSKSIYQNFLNDPTSYA
jgi:hypothetical protein